MDKVGTFAVAGDPTGTVFAPWQRARGRKQARDPGRGAAIGTLCWDELVTMVPDTAAWATAA